MKNIEDKSYIVNKNFAKVKDQRSEILIKSKVEIKLEV